jgi:hypothetical protein
MNREMNSGAFIRETVAPLLPSRGPVDTCPAVGIDEGLNNRQWVDPMLKRLVEESVISTAIPLWDQLRRRESGELFELVGSSGRKMREFFPSYDIGRPVKGHSTSDEDVVALLTSEFLSRDRVCLLTQNTKRDHGGLRSILELEIAPILENLKPKRLGILVLCQKPGSLLKEYTVLVEAILRAEIIAPGFEWRIVPN